MNTLIFTVGTRDVQIPAESIQKFKGLTFKDETGRISNHTFKNPREDAYLILDFLKSDEVTLADLHFPMAQALVSYCEEREITKPKIVLIATDQKKLETNIRQWNMDSLYVAELIGLYFLEQLPGSEVHYELACENIYLMQDMYEHFSELLSSQSSSALASNNEMEYTLMLQGGMDSINTALLLLAIENYSQSIFLGKYENSKVPSRLRFPATFKHKMHFKTVKPLLSNWQFYGLSQVLAVNSTEQLLALYAHSRMILNHEGARQQWGVLAKKGGPHREKLDNIIQDIQIINNPAALAKAKIIDIYLSGKIAYENGDTTNLMLRLYIMLENFLAHALIPVFGDSSKYYSVQCQQSKNENTKWREKINEYQGLENWMLQNSKGNKKNWIFVNPSTHGDLLIYNFFVIEGQISRQDGLLVENLWAALDQLRTIRNDISHEGKSASLLEINKRLRSSNKHSFKNIEELFLGLDKFLQVRGLMHFETIRDFIKDHY
jgi:hypothetical protein